MSTAHLAEAQIALIEAWVSGKAASTPAAVARLLHLSSNASASAWTDRRQK